VTGKQAGGGQLQQAFDVGDQPAPLDRWQVTIGVGPVTAVRILALRIEARACRSCEASNTSLYLQRIDGKGKATSFVFPGRITDPKKGALVYDGRLFYGHCLPSVKSGVVTHQREVVDRRGVQKSVLIAEPGPQYVYEVLLERKLPNVNTTLDLVKRKVCMEIPGRNRNVLKKPLDLSPKNGLEDDENEDDKNDEKNPEKPAENGDKKPSTEEG